jgi:hypothetical protein
MNHHSVSIIHIYFSLPLIYVVENAKIIKIADVALICLILYLLNSKKLTVNPIFWAFNKEVEEMLARACSYC